MKTLKLGYSRVADKSEYTVITVKNSVAYHPGEVLYKAEVDALSRNNAWDVTVVALNKEA